MRNAREYRNDEYDTEILSIKQIINDIDFNSEEDKLICESIINGIEKTAYEAVINHKTVSIPFIGTVKMNDLLKAIRKSKKDFKRMSFSKKGIPYKEYVRNKVKELKLEETLRLKQNNKISKIKSYNKNKYKELYAKIGRVYADTYIIAISKLESIEFNQEIEDVFNQLK